MKILITGGTGLLGSRLTQLLQEDGHTVAHLSRNVEGNEPVPTYRWDISTGYIDSKALEDVEAVVHLAGASVAGKRWTSEQKKHIYDSRINSTRLLYQAIEQRKDRPELFLSASAIGYYGAENGAHKLVESSPPGPDFLAQVCKDWEYEADLVAQLGVRVAKVRIGVVLSAEGGALEKMVQPTKMGLGAPLGSGNQYMSWIHIDDLCGILQKIITDKTLSGVYNGVAPHPKTNEEFMHTLAEVLDKPFWAPAVPAFALKLAMGEQAAIVTGSQRVMADKIEEAGYSFQYPYLRRALQQLLNRN